MTTDAAAATYPMRGAAAALAIALAVTLTACADDSTPVESAESLVAAKERAVSEAQDDLTAASEAFCQTSETYIDAMDRYGDVLNDTAPTVGDVVDAGDDLAVPREDALDGAEAAVEAQQSLVTAEQELADAQAALEAAQASASGSAAASTEPTAPPTAAPLAPAATVARVEQAEDEFATAQNGVTARTPLSDASEQFNSAAVALEFAWLKLFADAGCLSEEQEAYAAATAYTTAVQQDLTDAGFYDGAVDGVYGPETVGAVEDLQKANELPVTGTVDRATAAALDAQLAADAGAEADETLASTAALQQTLKLVGFWDGPVDGASTPELTEAVQALQTELGVEPTGVVDAATITAFEKAVADLQEPSPSPSPEPSEETETETEDE